MRWFLFSFLVVSSTLSVACGNPEGESDDTDRSQGPSTAMPEGGASQSPLDASSASDAGMGSDAAVREGGASPGDRTQDAGRATGSDGAVSAVEAGALSGRDASAGDSATSDASTVASDSPCPSDGPCKILAIGDSITYGLGTSDNSSYRVELFRKTLAANQRITFVGTVQSGPTMVDGMSFPRNNEGHSGWTISQVAGLVPSPALTSKPNIVLLMAGTNDMYVSPGPADAPKRLGALLDKLTAADPQMFIVVAQITPATSYAAAVKTFNAAVPAIVQERAMAGKHITLVDLNTGFPSGALADGVHPNSTGYKWMAGVWYDAIKQWLH